MRAQYFPGLSLDICDVHAGANLYGLGKGCYPKGKAPLPPFHPHCRCVIRSRPSLNAADAKERPGELQAHLRSMEPAQAARLLGSRSRLQAVLNGERLDDVLNAGVDEAYRLKRLGTLAPMKPHPQALPNFSTASISDEKLLSYALNPDHPHGGNKAKVFASALGYTLANAGQLKQELLKWLPTVAATERSPTKYGRSFSVDVPLTGPSGYAVVRTGWIIDVGDQTPRLVSAYVVRK